MEQLSNGDFIVQQDGARSHTSKVTLVYLQEHCYKFLKPDFWPPNSPGFNTCNYTICGTLEVKITKHNRFHITTFEDLKERIIEEWDALPQNVISRAIKSFKKRILMDNKKNDVHIDNIFRLTSNSFICFIYWFIKVKEKSWIFYDICFFNYLFL